MNSKHGQNKHEYSFLFFFASFRKLIVKSGVFDVLLKFYCKLILNNFKNKNQFPMFDSQILRNIRIYVCIYTHKGSE